MYSHCESLDNNHRDQNEFVSTKMGTKMANDLKISKFMEISALKDQQVPVIIKNYTVRIHRTTKTD